MDSLLVMFEACTDSPAYMRLDSEQEAAAAVLSIMGDNPELEELVNAHTYTAKQEGFVNGWAWAQATARECLALRKLPVLVENYGPDWRCGTCGWFVQHRGLPLVCCGGVWALYRPRAEHKKTSGP